jgi:dipeptidyl aminopeptidase/acylaminoacyl peptidase
LENLLGPDASSDAEARQALSLEHQINAQTPPTFIWHTFEDQAVPVENALLFAQGLRTQHIPFELHIYPSGAHGLSLSTPETDNGNGYDTHVSSWLALSIAWLEHIFRAETHA